MKISRLNFWIGRGAERIGLHIQRRSKMRQITVHAIPLALALIQRQHLHPEIVQIGAFDGTFQDPLHQFFVQNKHYRKAVLVEPQRAACDKLQALHGNNPRINIEPSAISTSEGMIAFLQSVCCRRVTFSLYGH